jgi:hypothetical protein
VTELYEDNLNNVRQETGRNFKNKKREYLKDKVNALDTNSKNENIRKLYRDINECKKGYQPITNFTHCGVQGVVTRNTTATPTQQPSSHSRGIPCSHKRDNDIRVTAV